MKLDLSTDPMALNKIMEIDHVIRVLEGGAIDPHPEPTVYAPEICLDTDNDGQVLPEHEADMIATVERQGWTLERGWSGQYMTGNSPNMHDSEFVGGRLAEHVLDHPGYWVAVALNVESHECPNESDACTLTSKCEQCRDDTGAQRESVSAGWALAFHEAGAAA